jgi:hypothetical protein
MSQQLLQPETRSGVIPRSVARTLPSGELGRRSQQSRRLLSRKTTGLTLAFAALTFLFALVYAAGWARLAREDYRHQRLGSEIRRLQADNARLRFGLYLARSPQRIAEVAARQGMRVADPARELDYVLLPDREKAAAAGKGALRIAQAKEELLPPPLGAGLLATSIPGRR